MVAGMEWLGAWNSWLPAVGRNCRYWFWFYIILFQVVTYRYYVFCVRYCRNQIAMLFIKFIIRLIGSGVIQCVRRLSPSDM
jgi:hypothetical protein